ncbi:hypothetical protein EC844_11425 [Acinetobacter calcoaceticus]|uniref:LemA family protein n=1 Tax=Acinetobacter calcoaceticus TaxID=471 RepID=A0A4V2R0S1_ACICA|nr:hypothetical protein EC844_11425 [Acinetobacter calcoaceticus]
MSYIILFIIIAIVFVIFTSYNKLQRSSQRVKETLSNISVSLQKKVNLVNQLIDTVKNYQDGEQLVHLSIAHESTRASDLASSQKAANQAIIGVQGFLHRFPELKANEQYQHLMRSIDNIENEISKQRERYNESVREHNTVRSTIPTVFVAGALKFPEAPYLDFSQENIEQHILKDFNTNSGEHLNALLGAATASFVENTKTIVNKAKDAGKKIAENENIQELRNKAKDSIAELTTTANPNSAQHEQSNTEIRASNSSTITTADSTTVAATDTQTNETDSSETIHANETDTRLKDVAEIEVNDATVNTQSDADKK